MITAIQRDVEERLAASEPDVEVLLAEVVGSGTLRVFIDHPDGVSLTLCEQVSMVLAPLREQYALEVSSPGSQRPLTKPEHFRRFVGQRARVRTRSALCPDEGGRARPAADDETGTTRGGRRRRAGARATHSVTGELLDASESEVTLAVREGVVAIPYSEIRRSNLVEP